MLIMDLDAVLNSALQELIEDDDNGLTSHSTRRELSSVASKTAKTQQTNAVASSTTSNQKEMNEIVENLFIHREDNLERMMEQEFKPKKSQPRVMLFSSSFVVGVWRRGLEVRG
jgi:Rps23 Pro-64 3,4-dihydroxylase Tpa1-like proline 4-hydroxylase